MLRAKKLHRKDEQSVEETSIVETYPCALNEVKKEEK